MNIDKIWKRKVRRATAKLLREGSATKIETVNVPCAVVISTNNHIENLCDKINSLGLTKPDVIDFSTSNRGLADLYRKGFTNLFALLDDGSCVRVQICKKIGDKIHFQTYLAGLSLHINPEHVVRLYNGNPNA